MALLGPLCTIRGSNESIQIVQTEPLGAPLFVIRESFFSVRDSDTRVLLHS